MSLLTPFFVLGALGISLPIIFHLIQRRPTGPMPFSSLMFLSPSLPRLTRRSRLDNLLLLLLRGLALLLLSLAFARPFLRSVAHLNLETPARRIVLAVDTSASMRREFGNPDGLWPQALARVDDFLSDIQQTDELALLTFADRVQTVVSFETWQNSEPARRADLVRDALLNIRIQNSWESTDLGRVLVAACDTIQNAGDDQGDDPLPPQIVLVTDLQQGSRLESLDAYEWPADVQVDIRTVSTRAPTNANARVLVAASEDGSDDRLRVRVQNAGDSVHAQFQLCWSEDGGEDRSPPFEVHVPPGQSRVVRLQRPPPGVQKLTLDGDDQAFDNTVYVATRSPVEKQLLFVGPPGTDRESLFYYLRHADLNSPTQTVAIVQKNAATPLDQLNPRYTPLVILGEMLSLPQIDAIKDYMRRGGRVLLVLDSPDTSDDVSLIGLRQLLSLDDLTVAEADTGDYAMLGEVDLRHELFQPFADPRFSDFTKIRFWKHRQLFFSNEQPWRVLAKFDDLQPALVEQDHGEGTLWVLTSGWQPNESQLALSTKFVPIISGMMDPGRGRTLLQDSYAVGDSIALPSSDTPTVISKSDGATFTVSPDVARFEQTTEPGVYAFFHGGEEQAFAVNLNPFESRTEPLDPERLEQRGVRLGKQKKMAAVVDERRQMRDVELESRQKLWRWGITGVLVVLAAEIWLAGRFSKRSR